MFCILGYLITLNALERLTSCCYVQQLSRRTDRAKRKPPVQFSQCRAAFSASLNSLVVRPDLPLILPSFLVDGRELHALAPNRIKYLAVEYCLTYRLNSGFEN